MTSSNMDFNLSKSGKGLLTKRAQLPVLLDLPYAKKTNHAEGIAVLTDGGHRQLLVIYDSAKKDRRLRAGAMKATLHRIPAIV
jgi:hypothetical protein